MDMYHTKLILDFNLYEQKIIKFIDDLSLYIGILNKDDSNNIENFSLDVSFNNVNYSINIQNETFFKEEKKGDVLIIRKPYNNIYI